MVALPLGPILRFAALPLLDPTRTTEPINYKLEFQTSYTIGAGPYPIDLRGLGDAPRKDPKATWKYLITAAPGLQGPAAYASVEQGLADIVNALESSYTYNGFYVTTSAEVSGQVGDLVVLGGDQSTQYVCFARCETLDVQPKAGSSVYALELPLQFTLLSPWLVVG